MQSVQKIIKIQGEDYEVRDPHKGTFCGGCSFLNGSCCAGSCLDEADCTGEHMNKVFVKVVAPLFPDNDSQLGMGNG